MFGILAQYAIVEMLEAEGKAYHSERRDISDKETNVHEEKSRGTGIDLNAIKQLDTYIKEMDKLQSQLDKLKQV